MSNRIPGAMLGLALTLSTGCGGGGADTVPPAVDGDTIHLTVSPLPVAANVWEQEYGVEVLVDVAVRPCPTTRTWIALLDPGKGLDPRSAVKVEERGACAYEAHLPVNTGRAPDVYEGNLTLRLCKDAFCNAEWTLDGATIPYRVTVDDALSAEILVDGTSVTDTSHVFTQSGARLYDLFFLKSGQTIEINASEPVSWSQRSGGVYATITELSSTPTFYRATITSTAAYGAGASILATTAGGKQLEVSVFIR